MKTAMKCLMAAIMLSLLASTALMAADFTPIYEGVEYAARTKTSPRTMNAYALRIDLCNPAVSFYATPGNGGSPLETTLQTTPSFRSTYGLEAAINANFFVPSGSYATVEGLLISNGTTVSTDQVGRQAQLRITAAKVASIVGTGGNPSGIHTAVAGDAYHLVNGNPLGDNISLAPRTSVGLSQDGRFLIMCVVDGRGAGGSQGATIYDMSNWMLDFGAYNAINLDGGGSSCICTASGGVLNNPSDGSPRAVAANLGVNTSGNVSRMDVFVRDTNNNIKQKYWTNSAGWSSTFADMGAPSGGAMSDPSAVSWGPKRIDLFVRGTDNAVYHRYYDEGWSASWTSLGGSIVGSPDACSWNVDRLDVFARSSSDRLLHKIWNGSAWSVWEDLGGTVTSDPSAVSWGPGRIDVFYRGDSGELIHKWCVSGQGWSGEQNLGNYNLVGGPDACAWDANRLDVFWRTTDNSIRHKWYNGSAWSGQEDMGVTLTSDPGCVSRAPGYIEIFARGGNAKLYHKYYEGSGSWSDWTGELGGIIVGGPDACSWSNDAGTHQ